MTTTIGTDIWHADEESEHVQDENRLQVRPLEIVKRIRRLQIALELTLLFHRGGKWTTADKLTWSDLTGEDDATTQVLCDHIRKALR